jgi:hypothetical protein
MELNFCHCLHNASQLCKMQLPPEDRTSREGCPPKDPPDIKEQGFCRVLTNERSRESV